MAEAIVDLTTGLYRFMVRFEPVVDASEPQKAAGAATFLRQAQTLVQRFTAERKNLGSTMARTADEIASSLRSLTDELSGGSPARQRLRSQWQRLCHQYEALLEQVRGACIQIPKGTRLEHLKPKNLARNIFHMANGVLGIGLYEFVLDRSGTLIVAGSLLAAFVTLEITRRLSARWNDHLYSSVFAVIARPNEATHVCTSTWYMAGLLLGVWLLPKHAIELGTLVLAFGDPVASLTGKRWGKAKIWADKSLVGSFAFVLCSATLMTAFIWWRMPTVTPWSAPLLALAVATAGAVAELFSTRINDNLTIPLVAGLAAACLIPAV